MYNLNIDNEKLSQYLFGIYEKEFFLVLELHFMPQWAVFLPRKPAARAARGGGAAGDPKWQKSENSIKFSK